nr:hypothetical protein [Treponema sp.]
MIFISISERMGASDENNNTDRRKAIKRLLLPTLPFLLFTACSTDSGSAQFSIRIKNENPAAYFIFAKTQGEMKEESIGYINQKETKEFAFENGTIVDELGFYSGLDLATKKLKKQMEYTTDTSSNCTLVLTPDGVQKK